MCPRPDLLEYFRKLLFMQTHVLATMLLSQIREQMVVPDLYVFTLKFHSNFSLYKKDKNMKKKISKKNLKKIYLYFMQLFSADAMIFSKKN